MIYFILVDVVAIVYTETLILGEGNVFALKVLLLAVMLMHVLVAAPFAGYLSPASAARFPLFKLNAYA